MGRHGGGLVVAALLATGCAPGDDVLGARSPVHFQTSVAGDRSLDGLSDDENAAICRDLQATVEAFVHNPVLIAAACRVNADTAADHALDRTQARAACHQAYDACLTELPKPVPGMSCNPDRTCSATVDDYAACMNAHLDLLAYMMELAPDCDHVDPDGAEHDESDDAAFEATMRVLLAPCAPYDQKCPS